jgi:hypothetical protein
MAPDPKPSRRRLTEAEWEDELQRAKDVQSADVERHVERPTSQLLPDEGFESGMTEWYQTPAKPLRTRTGRRRSWWQRGWKR